MKTHFNLSYEELFNHEIANDEGTLSNLDAFIVDTGMFTGRSPSDKYFVNEEPSNRFISWGKSNKPVKKEIFDRLLSEIKASFNNAEQVYIQDVYCGASLASRKKIRFITEVAWQAHFVKNMFIRPNDEELKDFKPDFTVYNACGHENDNYEKDGLNSPVFIMFNIEENVAIIGGTCYGGEMKKGIFSMMNYWLPLENKLPMHCAANVGVNGDVALLFGLSGTGKTTLSTDSRRRLIGDDEHGWDDEGVFNFEGGCYAKCINLDEEHEPEIYGAIKRNALLENVAFNDAGIVDFSSSAKTENTRVSYPIYHIKNHETSLKAGHASNIIFLTADAFGILPPISKLNLKQAMYYFLSGYTAKVAGTERGITEPTATFSACFGEPFLPLHPTVYAKLLGEKIQRHQVNIYLINTGWSGGAYGVGRRIPLKFTRCCLESVLNGAMLKADFEIFPIFNLLIPKEVKGVDSNILNPRNTWKNKDEYDAKKLELANMFINNFKRYEDIKEGIEYAKAGPNLPAT